MRSVAPLLVVLVVLVVLTALAARNRKRAFAADQRRAEAIAVGTEVMTTSGLYGTVVRRDDDTVLLSIAPGVEVKWALAALREVTELPDRYQPADRRRPTDGAH